MRKWGQWGRRETRLQLQSGLVRVNGSLVDDFALQVGPFDLVEWKNEVVQCRVSRSVMLYKPCGVVSATTDAEHETVIDLVDEDWAAELHLAGRLDRFTSGLVVLTNDSRLSEGLTEPSRKVGKRYRVGCNAEIREEMVATFLEGMWLAKEKQTTQPARVTVLSEKECLLTIYEGKHHQVKRMFAHFGVKVISLHREAIGPLELDPLLRAGEWRLLTESELQALKPKSGV